MTTLTDIRDALVNAIRAARRDAETEAVLLAGYLFGTDL